MKTFNWFLVLGLLLTSGFVLQAKAAVSCDPAVAECKNQYEVPPGGSFVNYFSNYPLGVENSSIKRAIIVLQGNERNAKGVYKTLYSVTKAQKLLSETLIVAPWIKGNDHGGLPLCTDGDCDSIEPNEVYWSTDGWKQGDNSLVQPYLSSFDLIDLMVQSLANSELFSALQRIVIAGHSAGGQFTQRYALGTFVDHETGPVAVEFLVANPSSYLYLDQKRPTWASFTAGGKYPEYGLGSSSPLTPDFIDPYSRSASPFVLATQFTSIKDTLNSLSGSSCGCTNTPCVYERFKYGFDMKPQDSSHYMCFEDSYQSCDWPGSVSDQVGMFLDKKVTYILGQLDNSTPTGSADANSDLDAKCGGNFQGPDRLSRGTFYYESLSRFGVHNHRLLFAGRAGHSASQIFQSYQAKRVFFGGDLPTKEYIAPSFQIRQKSTGRYLDALDNSAFTSMTQIKEDNLTQRWIITKVTGSEYTLQQVQTLRYLDANTSSSFGALTKEYANSASQRWMITPVPNEPQTYRIQHKVNGRYLDANTTSGYGVNTQTLQSNGTQSWIIQP